MRARELYAQPDRFAPVPVASEPAAPAAEVHDWPWNRREEPAAPSAVAAPAPVVETVVEIVSAPAAPASEAPASEAPASEAPAPATPVAEAPVAEAPAAPAPMTEAPAAPAVAAEAPAAPAQDAPAVKQAGEAPAVEPLPVAEVVPEPEPKGPPRRGWWKRLTS
jgi:hypothetical protein